MFPRHVDDRPPCPVGDAREHRRTPRQLVVVAVYLHRQRATGQRQDGVLVATRRQREAFARMKVGAVRWVTGIVLEQFKWVLAPSMRPLFL